MAVSLVSHDESGLLRDIRKLLKQDIAITAMTGYEQSTPLRLDDGAPRPKQGQRQPRPQQGRNTSPSHRPHGHVQQNGNSEHAAGNRKRRPRRNSAAKA
jgi:ATP-dependent RNA helicase RhlE